MIKYCVFPEGKCVTSKTEIPHVKNNKRFVSIFLENPSDDEITRICKEYRFQKKYFLSYTKEERSMRYSMKPLVFVFIDYYMENNEIMRTHLLFAMKKNVLVVVASKKSKYHSELFNTLVSRLMEEHKQNQLGYMLYYFLYEDARENYDVLDELENKVMAIEEGVRKSEIKPKLIDDIVKLKRKCFRMSKQLWASAKLIYTIKRGLTPLVLDRELLVLMDDVYDTLIHQIDLLTVQREILTDLLEIYATIINNNLAKISNELNIVMKKLTSLTVIIAVPTLIASFYGMNFKYMPELNSPYGYIITIITMMVLSVILYFLFHKKGWI